MDTYTTKDKIETIKGKSIKHTNIPTKFWCNDFSNVNGSTCCFNHYVNLPIKNHISYPIFKYETEMLQTLEDKTRIWVKKATGIGLTEIILRWLAFKALTEDWNNSQVVIVTGPRIELAITIINRMKKLFDDKIFDSKETVIELNGCRIEAFPSHHLDSARGLPNVKAMFMDEADFFPKKEQENALAICDRYLAKGTPYVVLASTPNLPGGLFETIEKEPNSLYEKIFLLYEVGLNLIYNPKEIELAKQSDSFESEYNGKYGHGIGNIFPYQLLNKITEEYELTIGDGQKLLTVDPAFGSSRFAIAGFEKIKDMVYIKEAVQFDRPSPSAMLDLVARKAKDFDYLVLVDSAHPGLIRDLREKGVNALEVNFRQELSNMTTESATAIKELRVRIHPIYRELLSQLKAVKYNDKGHPNKKELNFDLGDCFMMGCNQLKSFDYSAIHIPLGQQESLTAYKDLERICKACNKGNHESHSNEIWHEYEGEQTISHCKCSQCSTVKKKGLRIETEEFS